jgi:hypothetical protein
MKSETTNTLLRRLTRTLSRLQQIAQVGSAWRRLVRPCRHPLQQVQHLQPAASSRQHGVDRAAVEDRADAVAMAGQQPGQHANEFTGDLALGREVRPEVDARAEVDDEPGAELAVFGELADIGCCSRAVTFQSMWRTSS